jgi:tRNA-(ms[2]io[6]A)-hydroxylase
MKLLTLPPELERLAAREPALDTVLQTVSLQSPTADAWVECALAHPLELLDDHAQCELKAASNALAIVGRFPEHDVLVRRMSALAREEMQHYRLVRAELLRRGGRPTRPLPNSYVKGLGRARLGQRFALLDDLMVAALIEARSCERFVRLHRGLADEACRVEDSGGLAAFYDRLARSESGHAHLFVQLARTLFEPRVVAEELARRCEIEARVLQELPVSPRMHGGHRIG